MAYIKNPLSGGGGGGGSISVVNGIIEQYKAESGTIDAQTFVEFVNSGIPGVGEDAQLSTADNTGNVISAVLLADDKVFIAHSSGSSNYLYGMVCTISGTSITTGTDTQLRTGTHDGDHFSAVPLDNGNVFVAHSYNNHLYGMVCTINGTSITAGTDTQLSTGTYTGLVISAILLDNGNVFIAHSSGSSNYLYGMVCTISGTSITTGTDTQLSTTTGGTHSGEVISAVRLDNGNVFIAHSYSNNYYLYGMVCTISGTTITHGTDTQLSTADNTGYSISAVLLDNGNVFIAHRYGSYYYLYGMVCTISGTSITAGTDTQLSTGTHAGYHISAILLDNGNVFIAHSYSNNYYLYGMACTISGTSITAGTDTQLSTTVPYTGLAISAVRLDNGNVFIAHSSGSSNYLYGIMTDMSDVARVRAATSAGNIRGLTAQSITDTTAGSVWVLNTSSGSE